VTRGTTRPNSMASQRLVRETDNNLYQECKYDVDCYPEAVEYLCDKGPGAAMVEMRKPTPTSAKLARIVP
jgi:hypothetical protein